MNTPKLGKPKAGLLLIGSPRFKRMGDGLRRGTYHDRKSSDAKAIVSSLELDIDLVAPGIVYDRTDLGRAMDSFTSEKVDFIVAEFLSWAEDFGWIRFLRDTPETPVIFLNPVKERVDFADSVGDDDFIEFLCAGTLVGSLEAAGSIARIGRRNVTTVSGSREELRDQVLRFARAAKVRSVLRSSTFGLLANYNELMWATYIDPYNLFSRIGPELRHFSYSEYAETIASVSDADARKYQAELCSAYRVLDEIDDTSFLESARASMALGRLAEANSIDGLVFNDVDPAMFKLVGLRPGFYPPWFSRNQSVLVPEADTGACVIAYILKLISRKHVSFVEPFYVEVADNTFAGGHAGPNDHNDPAHAGNVLIARDVRFAKSNLRYAGAPFAWYRIPSGQKTMAQFAEANGVYKLVCTLVDALPGKHVIASYSHAMFRPKMPVTQLFDRILKIGTTQHFAVVDGDYRAELAFVARIMGFEFHEIS